MTAAIFEFKPVFEKAGMKSVNDSVTKPPSGLVKDMKELGFKTDMWFSKDYCNEICYEVFK